jgi:hypothetical protein
MPIPRLSALPPVPVIGSDTYFDEVLAWLAAMPGLCDGLRNVSAAIVAQATAAYGAGLETMGVVSGDQTVALGTRIVSLVRVYGVFAPGQRVCLWRDSDQGAMWGEVVGYAAVSRKGVVAELTVEVTAIRGQSDDGSWVVFPVPYLGSVSGSLAYLLPITDARTAAILRRGTGRMCVALPPVWSLWSPGRVLPPEVTFTRASTGTRRNAAGGLSVVADGAPRWHCDRDGTPLGLLVEGARTNLVTQSQTVADKIVALAAGTYAVSIEGADGSSLEVYDDGTPANSLGVATPDAWLRLELAAAKTVTLRPVGGVTAIQCEAASYPGSHIPTAATSAARMADVATVALAGLDFVPGQGTLYVSGQAAPGVGAAAQVVACLDNGSSDNRIVVARQPDRRLTCTVVAGGVVQADMSLGEVADGADFRVAFGWAQNAFRAVLNAASETVDTSGAVPASLTTLRVGRDLAGHELDGAIFHLALFARPLGVADMWAVTVEA